MNTQQKMEVMQAYLDGKTIEIYAGGKYDRFAGEPVWNWKSGDTQPTYRVKSEPRFDWVLLYGDEVASYFPQCTEAEAKKGTILRAERMLVPARKYTLRKLEDMSCAITF